MLQILASYWSICCHVTSSFSLIGQEYGAVKAAKKWVQGNVDCKSVKPVFKFILSLVSIRSLLETKTYCISASVKSCHKMLIIKRPLAFKVLSSFQYYQQFQSLHTHMCVYSKISYKFEGIVPGYMEYGDNVFTFVLACVCVSSL